MGGVCTCVPEAPAQSLTPLPTSCFPWSPAHFPVFPCGNEVVLGIPQRAHTVKWRVIGLRNEGGLRSPLLRNAAG